MQPRTGKNVSLYSPTHALYSYVGRPIDTRNARCAKFNATEENYDFVLGVLSCVARVDEVGNLSILEKAFEIWNTAELE